jgi:Mg2+/Co2+ transporter CorC
MRGAMMQMNNDMIIGEALINDVMVTMIFMTIIEREQGLQICIMLLIDATQVRWLSLCVDASN